MGQISLLNLLQGHIVIYLLALLKVFTIMLLSIDADKLPNGSYKVMPRQNASQQMYLKVEYAWITYENSSIILGSDNTIDAYIDFV